MYSDEVSLWRIKMSVCGLLLTLFHRLLKGSVTNTIGYVPLNTPRVEDYVVHIALNLPPREEIEGLDVR
jgi:hypothetical protein